MPLCRHSTTAAPPSGPRPGTDIVRLSRYLVTRRLAPRAANDNRRQRGMPVWPWAVAMAAAPAVTAALILSQMI